MRSILTFGLTENHFAFSGLTRKSRKSIESVLDALGLSKRQNWKWRDDGFIILYVSPSQWDGIRFALERHIERIGGKVETPRLVDVFIDQSGDCRREFVKPTPRYHKGR